MNLKALKILELLLGFLPPRKTSLFMFMAPPSPPQTVKYFLIRWLFLAYLQEIKFAFSIYDTESNNTIDASLLGDLLRACDLNPTNAIIEKMGGTKKKGNTFRDVLFFLLEIRDLLIQLILYSGEKTFTVEEVMPIYSQVKNDKDQGVYEDFVECLKQYDKQEDGKMLAAELSHILLAIGKNGITRSPSSLDSVECSYLQVFQCWSKLDQWQVCFSKNWIYFLPGRGYSSERRV